MPILRLSSGRGFAAMSVGILTLIVGLAMLGPVSGSTSGVELAGSASEVGSAARSAIEVGCKEGVRSQSGEERFVVGEGCVDGSSTCGRPSF